MIDLLRGKHVFYVSKFWKTLNNNEDNYFCQGGYVLTHVVDWLVGLWDC